jgi:hypothetical protein
MNEWKKVDDIKPEYNKEVLVYTSDKDVYLAYWSSSNMWYDITEECYMKEKVYGKVLCWIEIPALPVEEERKTKC